MQPDQKKRQCGKTAVDGVILGNQELEIEVGMLENLVLKIPVSQPETCKISDFSVSRCCRSPNIVGIDCIKLKTGPDV